MTTTEPQQGTYRPSRTCRVCSANVEVGEDHDCPYGSWVGE